MSSMDTQVIEDLLRAIAAEAMARYWCHIIYRDLGYGRSSIYLDIHGGEDGRFLGEANIADGQFVIKSIYGTYRFILADPAIDPVKALGCTFQFRLRAWSNDDTTTGNNQSSSDR